MKQITIRNIPDEIERIVKKEARVKGLSLNKAFISLLESNWCQVKGKEKRFHIMIWTTFSVYGQKKMKRHLITTWDYNGKIDEGLRKETR